MIIITTLIAKVYFPDSLTRGTIPNVRKTYAYQRTPEHLEEQQSFHDVSDDELEVLYSDDEEDKSHESSDELEEDPLLSDMSGHPEPTSARAHRVLEFDQTTTNRSQVYKRLFFCMIML